MQGEEKIMSLSRRLMLYCYGRKMLFHGITTPKAALKLKYFLTEKHIIHLRVFKPRAEGGGGKVFGKLPILAVQSVIIELIRVTGNKKA